MLSATLAAVLLGSPVISAGTEEAPITTEHWAGHQVTFGTREVPVLGTLETRLDTYVIARVRRQGATVQIDQRACKVEYGDIGGVKVYVDADALPDSRIVFEQVEGTPHLVATLADTPFYSRNLIAVRIAGCEATAVHESLSLDRFASRFVQFLLRFRTTSP